MKRILNALVLITCVLGLAVSSAAQGTMTMMGAGPGSVTTASDPLLTSLVASWKLSGLTDSAGSNTLTNNNTATFSTGKIGNALYTTKASSQFLSIASNAAVTTGQVDFTIGAWFYLDSTPGDDIMIVAKDAAASREYLLYFTSSAGDTVRLTLWQDNSTPVTVSWGSPVTTGTWYCVLAWYTASTRELAISINDGTPVTNTSSLDVQSGSTEFRIGSRAYSGFEGYWDGRIDNVNIWKRALTVGERSRFYNSGNGCEHNFSGCP